MSTPATVPDGALLGRAGLTPLGLWHGSFRSMSSPVRVQFDAAVPDPQRRLREVHRFFDDVCAQCTRFDEGSDLMQANRAAADWWPVGEWCFAALGEAAMAHRRTAGLFEPRVLATLAALGYGPAVPAPAATAGRWQPGLDPRSGRVRIGPSPVDLGGIAKGLAVRWAAELLHRAGARTFLLDAGGDCLAAGAGPGGRGWNVGVEDPHGGPEPIAVLSLRDRAVATSSTRLLRWRSGGRPVHHLIDPRTGAPSTAELVSVTVVDDDPADAEVHSKTLFLHGDGIAPASDELGVAALWTRPDGTVGASAAMLPHLLWTRS